MTITSKVFCSLIVLSLVVCTALVANYTGADTVIFSLPKDYYKPRGTILIPGRKTGSVKHKSDTIDIVTDTYEHDMVINYPAGFYCGAVGDVRTYIPCGRDILWTYQDNGTYFYYRPVLRSDIAAKASLLDYAKGFGLATGIMFLYGALRLSFDIQAVDGMIALGVGAAIGITGLALFAEYASWQNKVLLSEDVQYRIAQDMRNVGDARFDNYYGRYRFELMGTVPSDLLPYLEAHPDGVYMKDVQKSNHTYYQVAYRER